MRIYKYRQFTLVELLVVIAVIGILMTMLVPSLRKARVSGMAAVTVSNLSQIHKAIMSYAVQNNNFLFLTDDNPIGNRIQNGLDGGDWPRFTFEQMQGRPFPVQSGPAAAEMENSAAYKGVMYCPVKRSLFEEDRQGFQGRSDYSMNRFFKVKNRNIASGVIVGEKEPFITPGNGDTNAAARLHRGTYTTDRQHPSFVYLNRRSQALYIGGSVRSFSISEGIQVDNALNQEDDFQ